MPTSTRTAETRNGTRQAQPRRAASPNEVITLNAPVASRAPAELPSWANEP